MTAKSKATDLKRIYKALIYSVKGMATAWKKEAAVRQEVFGLLFLVPLAIWVGDSGLERALLMFAVLIVLLVEIINSAIEAVVDRFGEEHHELSGDAKDMGSAAVFLSIVIAVTVWGFVLFS